MKLDTKAIFSIFMILLFVGSILAVGLLYYDPERETQPTEDIPDAPEQQFLAIVDANVLETFPNFVLYGTPNVYEETTIENTLREIEGVNTVDISFIPIEEDIVALIHVGYDSEKKEEIYMQLQELEIFEQVDILQNGLLEIPKELEFKNPDTNQTKEYFHPAGKVEAIISYHTEKEDALFASVVGWFKGDTLIHLVAQEQQNLSTQQEMIFDQKVYEIESWNEKIILSAETDIYTEVDVNYLKKTFAEEEINVFVSENLEVVPDKNITDANQFDYIKEKEEVQDLIVKENIILSFKEKISVEEYINIKEEISSILEEYEITQEPKRNISIVFYKETIDVEAITNILEEKNLKILSINKSANIKLDDLVFNDKEHVYEQDITETHLRYPEDINKTELLFDVQGIAVRNEILQMWVMRAEERLDEEIEDYAEEQ